MVQRQQQLRSALGKHGTGLEQKGCKIKKANEHQETASKSQNTHAGIPHASRIKTQQAKDRPYSPYLFGDMANNGLRKWPVPLHSGVQGALVHVLCAQTSTLSEYMDQGFSDAITQTVENEKQKHTDTQQEETKIPNKDLAYRAP